MLNPNRAVARTQGTYERSQRLTVPRQAAADGRGSLPWHRLRVQMGGALVIALAAPAWVAMLVFADGAFNEPIYNSLLACLLAICGGAWLLRSLSTYPGMDANSHVLPAFVIAFGAVLAFVILGRFSYNRFLLTSSFAACIVWFNVVNIMIARSRALRIGVVPFGNVDGLEALERVTWVPLRNTEVGANDAIVADLRSDLPADWDRFLADCALNGVPVYHVKTLIESLTGRVELEHLSENSFGSLTPIGAYMSAKHALDRVTALITLVCLTPVLLVVAALVRLDSPGAAIFRQRRIGYRGATFTLFKFRTMRTRAVEGSIDDAMTRQDDARVTRVGRFLRRSRLDELPQLVNVLRGEMSLIGPRPEAEILSRWYETSIPFYRYRHIVRPGITGWAQVNQGHVAELHEVKTKLYFDFYYVKNFSPWLDLLIVARTVRTMLTGFGSR